MNLIDALVYFVVPALVLVYLYLRKKFSYFESKDIPHIKPPSWIMGNMDRTLNPGDFMRKHYEASKGKDVIAGFYSTLEPVILITDVELVKTITIKDFHNFTDRGTYVNTENEPITGSLLQIDGEQWRFLRTKLSPTFTSGKIKMMFSTISDKSDNLTNAVERATKANSGKSIDVKNIVTRFTVDIICSCAFGIEANTLNGENQEVINITRKIFGEEFSPVRFFLLNSFPKFAKFMNLRMWDKSVQEFCDNIFGNSIKQRETEDVKRYDFLNMLLQLKNKGSLDEEKDDSRRLTYNEVIANAFVFFLGGSDTSSFTISYAMIELAMHPEIQEKLRKEIKEKTASNKGEITYDNLNEMTYLNQVVNETLRKHPPVPVFLRKCLAEYKIPNSKHIIEKDAQIMIPTIGFHYDETYWKNPENFDPERFTPEETAKRPNQSFLPFGEGPRNCIGMRFGLINVKLAVATLVKDYHVKPDTAKTPYPPKLTPGSFLMTPLGGFWAKFDKV